MSLDERSALLVIDLQQATLANPTVHPVADIVANARALADGFRASGRLVVLATVTGTPAGRTTYGGGAREYPAELTAVTPDLGAQESDIRVARSTWSAFAGTALDETLRAAGVTQVVLVGVATSFGVESTARAAYDLGYSVLVVTDAVTDLRAESHENSVTRVFPVLAETTATSDILADL